MLKKSLSESTLSFHQIFQQVGTGRWDSLDTITKTAQIRRCFKVSPRESLEMIRDVTCQASELMYRRVQQTLGRYELLANAGNTPAENYSTEAIRTALAEGEEWSYKEALEDYDTLMEWIQHEMAVTRLRLSEGESMDGFYFNQTSADDFPQPSDEITPEDPAEDTETITEAPADPSDDIPEDTPETTTEATETASMDASKDTSKMIPKKREKPAEPVQETIFEVIEETPPDNEKPPQKAPETAYETDLSEDPGESPEPATEAPETTFPGADAEHIPDLIRVFLTDDNYGKQLKAGWAFTYSGTYKAFSDYCKAHGLKKKQIPEKGEFYSEMEILGYPLWIFAPRPSDWLDSSLMVCSEAGIEAFYRHCDPVKCTLETAKEVLEAQREKHRGFWDKLSQQGVQAQEQPTTEAPETALHGADPEQVVDDPPEPENPADVLESLDDPRWIQGFYQDVIDARDRDGISPTEELQKVDEVITAAEDMLRLRIRDLEKARQKIMTYDSAARAGESQYKPSPRHKPRDIREIIFDVECIVISQSDYDTSQLLGWAYHELQTIDDRMQNGTPYSSADAASA